MTAAPSRSLPHHVERYLLRCEVEAKSPDTLRAYRTALDRFVRILAEDGAPDAIDEITSDHSPTPRWIADRRPTSSRDRLPVAGDTAQGHDDVLGGRLDVRDETQRLIGRRTHPKL